MKTKGVTCSICFGPIILGQAIADVTINTLPPENEDAKFAQLHLGVVHRNNQNQCLRKALEMEKRYLAQNSN